MVDAFTSAYESQNLLIVYFKYEQLYVNYTSINKRTINICNIMDKSLKNITLWDTKDYILYDSIYMKFLEKTKLQRKKADEWLPGLEVRARGKL